MSGFVEIGGERVGQPIPGSSTSRQRREYAKASRENLLLTKLGHAMEDFNEAQVRLSEAREQRQLAVKHALRHGKSLRELADLMGISHSRVQQIAKEPRKP